MKKLMYAMIAGFVLAHTGAVWGHSAHHHHGGDEQAKTAEGVGEIRDIRLEEGVITLHHEPMEALNWPAMTMDFKLKSPEQVEGFSEGDAVHFVMQEGRGSYLILELHAR